MVALSRSLAGRQRNQSLAHSKDFRDELPADLCFVLEVIGVQGEVVLLGPGPEVIEEDEDHHVDQGDLPQKKGGYAPFSLSFSFGIKSLSENLTHPGYLLCCMASETASDCNSSSG